MKPITLYIALTVTCISFAFGEDQRETTNEQEVRQMIQKYGSALLQRDIPMLEKIWADDYVFVNASGEVLTKTQRLSNLKSGATSLDSINQEENITVLINTDRDVFLLVDRVGSVILNLARLHSTRSTKRKTSRSVFIRTVLW